jgi:hypothetical protein
MHTQVPVSAGTVTGYPGTSVSIKQLSEKGCIGRREASRKSSLLAADIIPATLLLQRRLLNAFAFSILKLCTAIWIHFPLVSFWFSFC